MKKTEKQSKGDRCQPTLFDFDDGLLTKEERLELIQPCQNRLVDVKDTEVDKDNSEELNLRSEQIFISKDNYPSISMSDDPRQFSDSINNISGCNHSSKNLFNQCLYQIRMALFNKIDDTKDDVEKNLRIKIRSVLNKFKQKSKDGKGFDYKNTIYKLLDKYFKDQSKIDKKNDNYSWSPQAAQQTIGLAVESWYNNDLAREDYPKHPQDYTGKPGICKYRRGNEYISVFTSQQCKIETKFILDLSSMNEDKLRHVRKNFVTFPDHLNIKPIETRLSNTTDLREVRIIPLLMRETYKIELVYKKVIDKIRLKLKGQEGKTVEKIVNLKELNLDINRIIGIDTGQENVVTIANNIGNSPIIIKGGILLAINQWFDKIGSRLYSIYYRQQKFEGSKLKGQKVEMGSKMKILSFNRMNSILDILHKISRYIVNYCIMNRIGTIVWGRNPGWKQNINIGKRNNQKFTKIPHYLLFKILKYKAKEIGIKVIDHEESHTSKCSFLDLEPIGHKEKGQYVGKRIKRGLFRSAKGIIFSADVNAAYNIIRKVFPDAFNNILKTVGIEGIVLHPERLSISDLL